MKKYIGLLLGCFCLWATPVLAFEITNQNQVQIDQVSQLKNSVDEWRLALDAHDPQKITALYAKGALLYATFQNQIDTEQGIRDYFIKLMKHQNLKVVFNKMHIRLFSETAVVSGLYDFTYINNHEPVSIKARYTLVYAYTPGKNWQIVEHHSSVLPK